MSQSQCLMVGIQTAVWELAKQLHDAGHEEVHLYGAMVMSGMN